MVLAALGAVEGVQFFVVEAPMKDPLAHTFVVEAMRARERPQFVSVCVRVETDGTCGEVFVFFGLVWRSARPLGPTAYRRSGVHFCGNLTK